MKSPMKTWKGESRPTRHSVAEGARAEISWGMVEKNADISRSALAISQRYGGGAQFTLEAGSSQNFSGHTYNL